MTVGAVKMIFNVNVQVFMWKRSFTEKWLYQRYLMSEKLRFEDDCEARARRNGNYVLTE